MDRHRISRTIARAGTVVAVLIAAILVSACVSTGTGEHTGDTVTTAPIPAPMNAGGNGQISLPSPDHISASTLDYALGNRRSQRDYSDRPLSAENLSLILWSGQGITDPETGQRTAPSAMRIYPLTLYVAVSDVEGIPRGVYMYDPKTNSLNRYLGETGRDSLLDTLGQKQALSAPVTIVVSANYTVFFQRMQSREDVVLNVGLEAGHTVQNILLMETSRGMAGVPFTGFNMTAAGEVLDLPENNSVIYAVTAGYPVQ